jgi:predicted nucleic acid-binding Zn ribbon protein
MTQTPDDDDLDSDDDETREWPDESDMDEDMLDDTIPCPHCKKPIHEQSEFCPHCGNYLSEEDAPNRKSLWIILGVAACVLILIYWAM